jgi:bifunctional non-homologous end joining protein LigD
MPPDTSRFGQPINLARVHWVKAELVCEVKFLAWTDDAQMREVIYVGLREDKPARDVRRAIPAKTGDVDATRRRPQRATTASGAKHRVPKNNIMRVLPDAVVPTREQLTAYWKGVGTAALTYVARRPLTLVRHVNGLTFFHKGPLPPIPRSVHHLTIEKREGGEGVRVWVDSVAGLLGLLQMDAVELHPWGASYDDIEHPDLLIFDLDPGPGIEWEFVLDTALGLRDVLQAESLEPWVKTSGGKGLQVMVPIPDRLWSWDRARLWTKDIAQRFATRDRRYTLSSTVDRRNRLFIDYLRNGRGSTAVGAYSPRARRGFPVSMPVSWAEVEGGIRADAYTIDRLPRDLPRLKRSKKRR